MQIKTIIKYQYKPTQMAKKKKKNSNSQMKI